MSAHPFTTDPVITARTAPPWVVGHDVSGFDALRASVETVPWQRAVLAGRPAAGARLWRAVVPGHQSCAAFTECNVPLALRGAIEEPTLHLSAVGNVYRLGRQRVVVEHPLQAVVMPAHCELTRESAAGATSALLLHGRLWRGELQSRTARDRVELPARLQRVTLGAAELQAWRGALTRLVQAAGPGEDPRRLAHAEAALVALMARVLEPLPPGRHEGRIDDHRLARVEAWIDAHLAEPLSLGRLCAVAGVGARCLQKSFEARRGLSPMRFVAERRLAEAYRRLSRAEPAPSVKAVAIDLGFLHLGRFAESYRQLYGELPSQTLALRRGAA